jgi:hypothetical protein
MVSILYLSISFVMIFILIVWTIVSKDALDDYLLLAVILCIIGLIFAYWIFS